MTKAREIENDKKSPQKDPLRQEVLALQASGSLSQAQSLSVFLDLRDQIIENAAASKLPDNASAGILELAHETCTLAAKTLRSTR